MIFSFLHLSVKANVPYRVFCMIMKIIFSLAFEMKFKFECVLRILTFTKWISMSCLQINKYYLQESVRHELILNKYGNFIFFLNWYLSHRISAILANKCYYRNLI